MSPLKKRENERKPGSELYCMSAKMFRSIKSIQYTELAHVPAEAHEAKRRKDTNDSKSEGCGLGYCERVITSGV